MIIRIILTILLIIAVLIAYLLFVPISFGVTGDFDRKYLKVYLHDLLRFINLNYDTSSDNKFSLRLFYFVRIGAKKGRNNAGNKKSEKRKQKKSSSPKKESGRKKRLSEFIKKRLKVMISSIFSFLGKCNIHVSDCDISFSTGEPDTSALVYGGIASLPFMYGKDKEISVDLMSDDAFVKGHIKVSGSIFVFILLYYCVKVIAAKGD